MTFQDLQTQILQLPTAQKWQLVQTLLNAIQQDTAAPAPSQKTYSLRRLPIAISEDFDDPMAELWEALGE